MDYPDKKQRVVGRPEGGYLTRGETYLKLTNVFSSPMKGYSWNKAYKTAIIKKYHLKFDRDISLLEDQILTLNIFLWLKASITRKSRITTTGRERAVLFTSLILKKLRIISGEITGFGAKLSVQ